MKVIRDWRAFAEAGGRRGGVLSVGNFDGVHVGHAAMLRAGRAEAERRGGAGGGSAGFTIMTFDPHPGVVLGKGARAPLVTLEQKIDLLSGFGAEVLIVIETTREFLGMEPEVFLREVVAGGLGAEVMVEGPTFTFGRGARGTVGMLAERGKEFGVEVVVVPTQEVVLSDLTVVRVSSSLVRWLVGQGRVMDAGKCLGRAYALRGEVVAGEKRGRTIGFPTANVRTEQLLPGAEIGGGVFGGWVKLADGRRFAAAMSVGTNPTFRGKETTAEAFLLDFSGDLYGQVVEVGFERWVREMVAFGGVEGLVRQMERDVAEVRGFKWGTGAIGEIGEASG